MVDRLGKPPESFGRVPEAFRKVSHKYCIVLHNHAEPWLSVVGKGAQWNPCDRASAMQIADLWRFVGDPASAVVRASPTDSPQQLSSEEGGLAPAVVRASPPDSSLPALSGAPDTDLPLSLGPAHPRVNEQALFPKPVH